MPTPAGTAQRSRRRAPAQPPLASRVARPALIVLVAAALLAAVAGGLVRAGVAWPNLHGTAVIAHATLGHAALMLSGFLGTVVAIERAVAIKLPWAFLAPFMSGMAGVLLLAGRAEIAAWLWVLAGLAFVGVNVVLVLRQAAAHTVLLLVGAAAWLIGSLLFAVASPGHALLPWWFAFLVLTIAAERLEMTRLTRRHPLARGWLQAILATLLAAAALSATEPTPGGIVYGAALVALALWLVRFDIARHTIRSRGLARYMAVCLLSGYAWLGVAGLGWVAMAIGLPARDLAWHALGLGFAFSMVMGHAPVILPAVARVKLLHGPWFYAPLVLLHMSLVTRLLGGLASPDLRALGASLNAAALVLFALTVFGSALAWRRREAILLRGAR